MTIREALARSCKKLEEAGIDSARLDSEHLAAASLGMPRLRLGLCGEQPFPAGAQRRLRRLVRRRQSRRPLAYVMKEQPFLHLSLQVTPDVLVPRPETEELAERALRILDALKAARVVDVCTGSGNIALALAAHPNTGQLIGIDRSSRALAIARRNARRHHLEGKVRWIPGDLLGPVLGRRWKFDLLTANPPYVRRGDIAKLAPELQWEPRLALDGGPDGLRVIRRLVPQAAQALKPEAVFLMEIGAAQGAVVRRLFQASLWEQVKIHKDLAGRDRIVEARRKGPPWIS